ncbi:response regulator [Cylindrospermopsis raciborskii CHAB3438]|nr:response regulator [Cyanobacteria bacterium REEB494]MCH4903603.1 response regulator [Cylindrospermopsis raciborskii CHAB3438]
MMKRRILVVDNEQYIQEVAKICLETVAGWEVLTAGSGKEGILQAENHQPDAILLDVMMPDMDGLSAFEKLQANPATQTIPVILLTAKIQIADRRRYSQLGIKSAIAKPFNPLELAHQVAAELDWNLECNKTK